MLASGMKLGVLPAWPCVDVNTYYCSTNTFFSVRESAPNRYMYSLAATVRVPRYHSCGRAGCAGVVGWCARTRSAGCTSHSRVRAA